MSTLDDAPAAVTALLDQLDAAHAAATDGPWYFDRERLAANNETGDFLFDFRGVVLVADHPIGVQECTADGELIVAAVNSLPRLTAALRAVLALADELTSTAKTTRTSSLPHTRPGAIDRARLYDDLARELRDRVASALAEEEGR